MSLLAPFFLCLLLTLTLQGLGFAHAFRFQTEKFYDLVGGANSLLILLLLGLLSAGKDSSGAGFGLRKWLLALAFAGSRGWLLALLVSRRKQREGDARFAEFRAHFWQFGVVWLLQAGWVFCVALPVIVVLGAETNEGLGLTDLLLFALLYGAVFAQVLADLQKQNWIQAGRPGGFCNVGLWFLSRHPNYCAEMVFWWCAWAVCSALWSLFDVEVGSRRSSCDRSRTQGRQQAVVVVTIVRRGDTLLGSYAGWSAVWRLSRFRLIVVNTQHDCSPKSAKSFVFVPGHAHGDQHPPHIKILPPCPVPSTSRSHHNSNNSTRSSSCSPYSPR